MSMMEDLKKKGRPGLVYRVALMILYFLLCIGIPALFIYVLGIDSIIFSGLIIGGFIIGILFIFIFHEYFIEIKELD